MPQLNLVGVSGSLSRPSRTSALVSTAQDAVQESESAHARLIDLAGAASGLFSAASYDRLPREGREVIDSIEAADLLVVGTPVYRGSYTGAFKHLFDLVRHDRLRGKPVILTATGGSQMHALMIEHQLRPLFGFFGALTLPTTIYATEADFQDYALVSEPIRQRIGDAAAEAIRAVASRSHTARPSPARLAVAV